MNARGFTLVELLLTTVILGILAAIVSNVVTNARRSAYVAAMQSDLRNLATAQEAFYDEAGGSYAPSVKDLAFEPARGVRIRIRAKENGWSARAEHERLKPEKYFCAVFLGDVKPFDPAEDEGVVECAPKKKRRKPKKK